MKKREPEAEYEGVTGRELDKAVSACVKAGENIAGRQQQEPAPHGAYYALRKTENGLWTVDCVEYDKGALVDYNPSVTAPDLQNMTYIKLQRILEKRYVK